MEIFKQQKIFDFVRWSKYGLIASILLTLASFYLFFGVGFNLGIDFAGGSTAQIQYTQQNAPMAEIRKLLATDERFKNALK